MVYHPCTVQENTKVNRTKKYIIIKNTKDRNGMHVQILYHLPNKGKYPNVRKHESSLHGCL